MTSKIIDILMNRRAVPTTPGVLLVCVAVAVASQNSLAGHDPWLPFRTMPVPVLGINAPDYHPFYHTFAQLDDDPEPELVFAQEIGLIGFGTVRGQPRVLFQYNLEPAYTTDGVTPDLGVTSDLDHDGRDEIAFTVRNHLTGAWRIRIYDPAVGQLSHDWELPQSEGFRDDGVWDGSYAVIAVLPATSGREHPLAILACEVRYDRYGRGLVAINLDDGSVTWSYTMGPNPMAEATWTGDLDDDGILEFVVPANSPGNLKGELVNGTSDLHATLFVIDERGRADWVRALGGEHYTPWCEVGDLDGDGSLEVVTVTENHRPDPAARNELVVWSGDGGDLLARIQDVANFKGLELVAATAQKAGMIFVGSDDGHLRRLAWDGTGLVEEQVRRGEGPIGVLRVGDFVGDQAAEILCSRGAEGIEILATDLSPLAIWRSPCHVSSREYALLWRAEPEVRIALAWTADGRESVTFVASERPPRQLTAWAAAPLVAVVAFATGWRLWSRGKNRGQRSDLALRLLQDLEESNHGTLSATGGLRRSIWLLGAASRSESGAPAGSTSRIQDSLVDFRDVVAPRLERILALAAEIGCDPAVVTAGRRALRRAATALEQLHNTGLQPAMIRASLDVIQQDAAAIEHCLGQLAEATSAEFATDVAALVRRLASLQEDECRRLDVQLQIAGNAAEPASPSLARIDEADMHFVLENLLSNALRAMAGAPTRTITIALGHTSDRIEIQVADTGCGIPEEHRSRVFEPGFSTRQGGGLGLARSREILRRWRGRLDLTRSEPGIGTTFRIELAMARNDREDDRG